jgi:hypothetical protein
LSFTFGHCIVCPLLLAIVLCVLYFWPLFAFCHLLLVIVLFVLLRFTASNNPVAVFKISLHFWPWSYGSWIYNYLCNQSLSPLMLEVRISITARYTTLCDKVCQWLATSRWFPPPIIRYCWNIVESGVKHHQTNKQIHFWLMLNI